MASFIGQDRNGRITELTDEWSLLPPITSRERDMLMAIRLYEDLIIRRQESPTDGTLEEQIDLARTVIIGMVDRIETIGERRNDQEVRTRREKYNVLIQDLIERINASDIDQYGKEELVTSIRWRMT